ncbi:MAG: hypothetical protein ACTSR5_18515 [Promethearchaeota archaeon]
MTQVKLDKAVADSILKRWNETSTKIFLEKARSGEYENAEEDAVELRQLLLDYSKFQELLNNF